LNIEETDTGMKRCILDLSADILYVFKPIKNFPDEELSCGFEAFPKIVTFPENVAFP